jgi:phage gpG-like protein
MPAYPPITIAIGITGHSDVSLMLRGVEERAKDLTPAWPEVVRTFRAIVENQFATEGAHGGAPWQPLARATQLDRVRNGLQPGHPILVRTGALKRSLTADSGDAIVAMTPTQLRVGSGVEYFPFLEGGTSRMPARPPVELTSDDLDHLMRPIAVYLRPKSGTIGAAPARAALQRSLHAGTG